MSWDGSGSLHLAAASEGRNHPGNWGADPTSYFDPTPQPYPTPTDPPGQSRPTQQILDWTSVETPGQLAAKRRRIREPIFKCHVDGCKIEFTTKQNLNSNFFLIYHSPLFLNWYLEFQSIYQEHMMISGLINV